MRLGSILLAALYHNKIPYRFRKKHRVIKKPTMHDLLKMKIDFDIEERNMLILRHPYLTTEQSYGHKKAMCDRGELFKDEMYETTRKKFSKQITFAERLSHLGYGEQWD